MFNIDDSPLSDIVGPLEDRIVALEAQVGRLKGLLVDLPYPDCACEYHINLMERIAAELKEE